MNIAIIPARSGSKRIPGKNVKSFAGKPIISYSIKEALSTMLFDKVLVSTDSNNIAKIANYYGAETPFLRPSDLSDDYAGVSDVIVHSIEWLELNKYEIQNVCCIYATAPFIDKNDIKNGFNKLINEKWSYVLSVGEFESPVQKAIVQNKAGKLNLLFSKENFYKRSQDLNQVYFDAAQFCWGKKAPG